MSGRRERGALAIVLHTHMPYVEGFGTWPFGEEWLWEAIACCYLPLLDLLDEDAPLTLSLTPVLCDQLEASAVAGRFGAFVRNVRQATHARDAAGLREGGFTDLAAEVERASGDYAAALENLGRRGGDLLGAFARHAHWTSAATHAVLPLLASDAGVRMQVQTGVDSHRRRFGSDWRGGFWLPECAYAPWLDRALEEAGVGSVCVELTGPLGVGAAEHLRPIATDAGVVLVPIDRATMALVWSEQGYPSAGAYRDYHHHTIHHHNPWDNDGNAYDHAAALKLAGEHAADFVARTIVRLGEAAVATDASGSEAAEPLVVCALDTELFGHWWYEGTAWLCAVVEQCSLQGLELLRLDEALERIEPVRVDVQRERGARSSSTGHRCAVLARAIERASSWGSNGDLSTWSGPAVDEMAFAARAAELALLGSGERPSATALRELLALQASDWPFMITREIAAPYARERFEGHRVAFARALREGGDHGRDAGRDGGSDADSGRDGDAGERARALRNLAPAADPASLLMVL